MSGEVVSLGGERSQEARLSALGVSEMLRALADTIDKGEHGHVIRGAVVLRASGLEPLVFGHGRTDANQTFIDLHAGAQQLLYMRHATRD
jgi:hypothetical protein